MLVMSSSVLLALFSLVSVLHYCHSQDDDGIVISLGDRVIPNHGLVTTEDIGVDPTGANRTVGLSCSTIYYGCCSDFTQLSDSTYYGISPSGDGSWLYAHALESLYVPRQTDQPNFISGITRNGSAVCVFRNSESDNNRLHLVNGIWRCVIPDSNGTEQTKYIGIYTNQTSCNNGTLLVGSPSTISIVSDDQVVFNLTFRTTGGPATYVTWTRDGVNISSLRDNHYTPSQLVVPNDDGLYTDGDYSNILTVNGRLSGVYGVNVTNDRTTTPVTSNIAVLLDYPQDVITNGSAMQSDTDGDITIAWTVSDSSLVSRFFDGYEIQYRKCSLGQQNGCVDLQLAISDTTSTHYILSNVTPWAAYEFTITLVNKSNHHFFPGVSGLSLAGIQVTTRGVLAPENVSVIPLANITSVQVIWNQPEEGLAVDEYVVSYHRLNGRDGQCSSFQDGVNVTLRVGRERVTSTTLHLQASSVYIVNVTGRKGALYNTSDYVQFDTNSTDEKQDSNNATTAGLTTVIVIQFVALVTCGVIIAIGAYRMKLLSKGGNTNTRAQSKEDGAIYEEPDILTSTPALELEACPAYEVTKLR